MIRVIIFDIGGVVHAYDDVHIRKALAEYVGADVPEGKLKKVVDELFVRWGRGEFNEAEFYPLLLETFGKSKPAPQHSLLLAGSEDWLIDENVVRLIEKLKEKNYTLAALSTTIDVHANWNRKRGVFDSFDEVILSHEVGVRKPDRRIYEITLARLGVMPHETVFIDDAVANVDAARAIGMHAIRFTGYKQLVGELKSMGVSISAQ